MNGSKCCHQPLEQPPQTQPLPPLKVGQSSSAKQLAEYVRRALWTTSFSGLQNKKNEITTLLYKEIWIWQLWIRTKQILVYLKSMFNKSILADSILTKSIFPYSKDNFIMVRLGFELKTMTLRHSSLQWMLVNGYFADFLHRHVFIFLENHFW